jgi:hypothetical protein
MRSVLHIGAASAGLLLAATVLPAAALGAPERAATAFAAAEYLTTGTTLTHAVEVADVTGDGRADVLAAVGPSDGSETRTLLVYPQRPDGGLDAPVRFAGHGGSYDARLEVADLDGDGRTDVAMMTTDGVDVFYQRPGGGLDAPVLVGSRGADVAIADVTGDGRRDLVVSAQQGELRVYPQTPSRGFGAAMVVVGPGRTGNPQDQVFAADLNGDGRVDLAQAHGYGVWVRLRQVDGTFSAAKTYEQAPGPSGYVWSSCGARVGDLTGDGRTDLVINAGGNGSTAAVNVFAQAGRGLQATPVVYPAYDVPCGSAIADLTGDGRAELIVGHQGWLAVSVYQQRPDGTLGAYTTSEVYGVYGPDGVAVGDINGDGKPDVVTSGYKQVAVLRQL